MTCVKHGKGFNIHLSMFLLKRLMLQASIKSS